MIDITVQNFEAELVHGSIEQPVLLDIWAPWCGPCKTLGPVLEKLEVAYAGRFRLGKLNSDEQPEIAGQLSQMFGVRSIPFCVLFKEGQPIDGFVGALPEAQALLAAGDTDSALERLQEAVAIDPANDTARYDYLRALLTVGRVADARRAFDPVAGKMLLDPRLAAAGLWLEACERAPAARPPAALAAAIGADKRDFDARYELAQTHFAAQRFTEAMNELLEIVMRDKSWRDELARKTYVAILELMAKPAPKPAPAEAKGALEVAGKASLAPSDPLLDQYRRKLSMALF